MLPASVSPFPRGNSRGRPLNFGNEPPPCPLKEGDSHYRNIIFETYVKYLKINTPLTF
jgi:hypothetical protein